MFETGTFKIYEDVKCKFKEYDKVICDTGTGHPWKGVIIHRTILAVPGHGWQPNYDVEGVEENKGRIAFGFLESYLQPYT